METRFGICEKVWFFNTTAEKVEEDVVRGIRIMGTAIHADESGEDVCDEAVVLYEMKQGLVLSEKEVFASAEACIEHYRKVFGVA